jgi:hypothetical protein
MNKVTTTLERNGIGKNILSKFHLAYRYICAHFKEIQQIVNKELNTQDSLKRIA